MVRWHLIAKAVLMHCSERLLAGALNQVAKCPIAYAFELVLHQATNCEKCTGATDDIH